MSISPIITQHHEPESNRYLNSPTTEQEAAQLTKIILVKGVPYGLEKKALKEKMQRWGRIKRIISKPSTSHYYIEYEIVIYKKKNTQALIELESIEIAKTIKEKHLEISQKHGVRMKIQYTNKKFLIVNKNSEYEHDFKKTAHSTGEAQNFVNMNFPFLNINRMRPRKHSHQSYFTMTNQTQNNLSNFAQFSPNLNPTNKLNFNMPQPVRKGYHRGSFHSVDNQNQFSFPFQMKPQMNMTKFNSLVFRNFPNCFNFDMCFNLFSLYGNIETVWLNFQYKCGMVTFQNMEQMTLALLNLRDISFFGKILKLSRAVEDQFGEQLAYSGLMKDYSNFKDQRFKIPGSKNFKNLNPPCSTLHLSNLPENVELGIIVDLFKEVAAPTKISYFNEFTNMALANFNSVDEAVEVLTSFHNHNISGSLENSPTKIRTASGYWGKTTNSPLSINLEETDPILGMTPSVSPESLRGETSSDLNISPKLILSAESTNEESEGSQEEKCLRGLCGGADEDRRVEEEESIENNQMIQKVLSNLGI